MSKIALVTDSSAYIPKVLVGDYPIHIAPLQVIWMVKCFGMGLISNPMNSTPGWKIQKPCQRPLNLHQLILSKFINLYWIKGTRYSVYIYHPSYPAPTTQQSRQKKHCPIAIKLNWLTLFLPVWQWDFPSWQQPRQQVGVPR